MGVTELEREGHGSVVWSGRPEVEVKAVEEEQR
jgi:hypothetical protein